MLQLQVLPASILGANGKRGKEGVKTLSTGQVWKQRLWELEGQAHGPQLMKVKERNKSQLLKMGSHLED